MGIQTKQIRKALLSYAALAHERELKSALDILANDFERWRAGEISSFDLSDNIHEFHNRTAVDIWKKYNGLDPEFAVAGAIIRGFLDRSELPSEVFEAVSHTLGQLNLTG